MASLSILANSAVRAAGMSPSQAVPVARAKVHINAIYQSVCHSGESWDFVTHQRQITVQPGSGVYNFASIALAISAYSIQQVLGVVLDSIPDRPPLAHISWAEAEAICLSTEDGQAPGIPVAFATWNDNLRLVPAPEKAMTLGLLLRVGVPELGDSGEPVIPQSFHERLLVPWAAAKLLMEEGGAEAMAAADRYMAEFREARRELVRAHGSPPETQLSLVSPILEQDIYFQGL